MRLFLCGLFACICLLASAQTIEKKIAAAMAVFEQDPQLKYAISSLYVADARTGKVIFEKNSRVGLAPASCMKVVTSVTAMELLGPAFRYKTVLGYSGTLSNKVLKGNVGVLSSGDPSFGSDRFASTGRELILSNWATALRKTGIAEIQGEVQVNQYNWETAAVPGGWIYEDMGNYYGAAAHALNWGENKYAVVFEPGKKVGDPAKLLNTAPATYAVPELINEVTTGPAGSGDQAYMYLQPGAREALLGGTIPMGVKTFSIYVAHANPIQEFMAVFARQLEKEKISMSGDNMTTSVLPSPRFEQMTVSNIIATHLSPTLDSLNYWFLRKSINLYGEAFVKTMAMQKSGMGSRDSGLSVIKRFWQWKGLDPLELNMDDGSGLSPQNRVTTHALAEVLRYARNQSWYAAFRNALPEFNEMKMKSGSISGVKGFTGIHTSKSGQEYVFAFLVNNYNGASSTLTGKMYQVLNSLK